MLEIWTTAAAEGLLNSLWQGAALTAFAWLFLKVARNACASARYLVWYTTLAGILLLPVFHLVRATLPSGAPLVPQAVPEAAGSTPSAPPPAGLLAPSPALPLVIPAGTVASGFAAIWLAGAILLCLRLGVSYRRLRRIKRAAHPAPAPYDGWRKDWNAEAPSARNPELRSSGRIRLPLTAGLFRPAILFPERLLTRLSQAEAHVIWLHELAHVRRLDDWTKFGQRLAESILFFHPAVHWIGRQLENEREIACDNWVVERTGAARRYAACLAKLAEYASRRPAASPAPAMATDKKQIFRRVDMLINRKQNQESRVSGAIVMALLLPLVAAMVASDPMVVLAGPQSSNDAVEVAPAPPPPPAAAAAPELPAPPASASLGAPPSHPTPPAPPQAPAARPEPAPSRAPQPPPGISEESRLWLDELREEMAAVREQMRAAKDEFQQRIRQDLEPHHEQMRRLSREIRETVQKDLQEQVSQMKSLHRDLVEQGRSEQPDEARIKELHQQLADLEEKVARETETRMRAMEGKMRELELQMRPSEDAMREFERKMRELEKEMREKERVFREREREMRRKIEKAHEGPSQI